MSNSRPPRLPPAQAERPTQLAFEFPVEPRHEAEDFLVSASNERAYAAVESWPHWPDPVLVLTGPTGSGKSHLAAIFARRAHAWTVAARDVRVADVPHLASAGAIVVEDADKGPVEEAALFHLLNTIRGRSTALLITASASPDRWGLATPDLLSRLRLAPLVGIEQPDEPLLRALCVKLFLDRQLVVDTGVVEAVLARADRSFQGVHDAVAALDKLALAERRRVTRQLVGRVLGSSEAPPEA